MYLYLKDGRNTHRTLVLTTHDHEHVDLSSRALLFRVHNEKEALQVSVDFSPTLEIDLSDAKKLTVRRLRGCLGLINVGDGA